VRVAPITTKYETRGIRICTNPMQHNAETGLMFQGAAST